MNRKLSLEKEIEKSNRRIAGIADCVALAFGLWIIYEAINAPPHNILPSPLGYIVEGLKEPYNCGENYKKGEICPTNRFSGLSLLYK